MAEHSEPHGLSQKLGPPSWSFRFLRCFRQQSVDVHSLPEFGPEGGPTFFESPFCAAAIGAWAIVPGSPFPLVYCARLFRIHLPTFRLCEKLPSTMYVQCRLGHAPKQRATAACFFCWGLTQHLDSVSAGIFCRRVLRGSPFRVSLLHLLNMCPG